MYVGLLMFTQYHWIGNCNSYQILNKIGLDSKTIGKELTFLKILQKIDLNC